jgi:hypothetical protein
MLIGKKISNSIGYNNSRAVLLVIQLKDNGRLIVKEIESILFAFVENFPQI